MDGMDADDMDILKGRRRPNVDHDREKLLGSPPTNNPGDRRRKSHITKEPWNEQEMNDPVFFTPDHAGHGGGKQQHLGVRNDGRPKSLVQSPNNSQHTYDSQRSLSSPPQMAGVNADKSILVDKAVYTMQSGDVVREGSPETQSKAYIDQLIAEGYSNGLAKALALNTLAFNHRIWVIDNSGSMCIGDGHKIAQTGKRDDFKAVPATRWEEIQDTVKYHASMAALLKSPTLFKLLNDPGIAFGPQQFGIADKGDESIQDDIDSAIKIMKKVKPIGVTPLTRHIWEIQQSIKSLAPQLVAAGQKVAVVLATDGLPTDEDGYGGEYITDEFVRALRALEGLPVWLVVRLCTDEEPVTRFYNNLDAQVELSMEVLDDFIGEAREVYRHNKWLNYGLPMHRCREMGYHDRLFDLIDERPLTKGEIREFCSLIFGVEDVDDIPDPGADWPGFVREINFLLRKEKLQWNPIKKKLMPWINLKSLNKTYGDGSKCTVM